MSEQDSYCWFLGASFGGDQDQTHRFLEHGIWEQRNPSEKERTLIQSVQVGDWVVIKSAYTRKKGLEFNINHQVVSVLGVKARGRVVENPKDGCLLKVSWELGFQAKEWFFYTYRATVWKVSSSDGWMAQALIRFAIHDQPQDVERFCRDPFWSKRFLSTSEHETSKETQAINQILYGAAGTGKTYALQQLQQDYTKTLATQDHETFIAEKLRDRSWAEVIALVFLEESRSLRVPELIQHPLYLAKVKIHGIQKPQANAWAVLQRNAPEDSETVRVNKKSKWAWFDKDDAGLWRLLDAEREDLADLRQLLTSIQAGAQQGETIQRYRFVTFHQSYSYEDFIEGLRPVLADDERFADSPSDGQIRYEIKQGAFVELCERARQDPTHQYAMFIDEINRGNVSKIFGELISLIELDKRAGCENALSVTLPYSKQSFSVPANVSIYGTMNSADRSLTPLDTALRRRFEFVEFMPQPELLAEREQGADVEGVNLVALLQMLNDRIEVLLGRDYWLGHAYFWSVKTLSDLKNVMRHKIIPQLQEHCFEDWEKVRLILADNQKPDTARQFIQVKTANSTQLERLFGAGSITSSLPSYQVNPSVLLDKLESDTDVFLQAETYWAMYSA